MITYYDIINNNSHYNLSHSYTARNAWHHSWRNNLIICFKASVLMIGAFFYHFQERNNRWVISRWSNNMNICTQGKCRSYRYGSHAKWQPYCWYHVTIQSPPQKNKACRKQQASPYYHGFLSTEFLIFEYCEKT